MSWLQGLLGRRTAASGPGPESSRWWPAAHVSEGVVIRPLARSDETAWNAARSANVLWLHEWDATVPPGASATASTFRGLVARLEEQAVAGTTMPFAVDVDGAFAGQVTVNNIVRGSAQFASIGYWIDGRLAGRGAIPRAVAMVIDHCFTAAGLHRIEIAIRPENRNSLRVVEKLGLREIGFAPRFLHINGAWRDHRIFAVTVEELEGGSLLDRFLDKSQESHQ